MAVQNPAEIHQVDANALTDRLQSTVEGPLLSLVEFDRTGFNPLFVHDGTLGMYRDEQHMHEHFEEIHGYINLDLAEMSLFTEHIIPQADRVRALSTTLDVVQLVRVYAEECGFFLAVDPEEPVPPLVEVIEAFVEG